MRDGIVYLQVSRGVARRDHGFPAAVKPGLIVTAKSLDPRLGEANAARGVKVITLPDERWARPDIKTLQLLPNVLAKQAAREAGAYEAWFVDADGFVTEGASTNAWIVTQDGALVTRQADRAILRGVTRATLIDVAAREGARFEERAFSLAEALRAREAFFSSATNIAMPVVGDRRPADRRREARAGDARAAAQVSRGGGAVVNLIVAPIELPGQGTHRRPWTMRRSYAKIGA